MLEQLTQERQGELKSERNGKDESRYEIISLVFLDDDSVRVIDRNTREKFWATREYKDEKYTGNLRLENGTLVNLKAQKKGLEKNLMVNPLEEFKREMFGVSHTELQTEDGQVRLFLDEHFTVHYENHREGISWEKSYDQYDYPSVALSRDGESVRIVTKSKVNSGASYDTFYDTYDKNGKLVHHDEKLW